MQRHAFALTILTSMVLPGLSGLAQPAEAQLRVTADITGFAGYRYGTTAELDSLTLTLDPAVSYGFMADWLVERSGSMSIFIEFLFSEQFTNMIEDSLTTPPRKVDEIHVRYFHGAMAVAWDWRRLRSYLALSLGATRYLAEQRGNKTGFSIGMGFGLKYPTRSRLGVRVDSRWYATKINTEGSSWVCPDVGDCLNVNQILWLWQGDLVGGVYFAW